MKYIYIPSGSFMTMTHETSFTYFIMFYNKCGVMSLKKQILEIAVDDVLYPSIYRRL